MCKKLGLLFSLLCLFLPVQLIGQNLADSVHTLDKVTITQSRLNEYMAAGYQLPVDSTMLLLSSGESLTDLLRKQGLGHIRSYGPGGLASPSFRGTGSSHTSILWDGINLVSPLSGQLDLSLVPVFFFDNATVQTGGSTSLSGNGTIGANIHLTNNVRFGEGIVAKAAVHSGSFGKRFFGSQFRLSTNNFESSTKVFLTSADNDFKFRDKNKINGGIIRRKHSAFDQHGILQQFTHQVSQRSIVSLKLWYQNSQYEVPGIASNQDSAEATEENTFYRILGGWNYVDRKLDINFQSAFIRQDLDYRDPKTSTYSLNRYNNIIQNTEIGFQLTPRSKITTGIQYSWEEGVVQAFGAAHPKRNRIAILTAYKIQPSEKWDLSISAREELIDGKTTPLAPALGVAYHPGKAFTVFVNSSRNYRLPTFNDLYWLGGGARGNPSLAPELSLSTETGFNFEREGFTLKAVGFSNHVDDWILWSPDASNVWTPQNIKKVWARGVEVQTAIRHEVGPLNYSLSGLYSFTRSTNESIYENGNPNETGKQLMLTPVHEASGTLHLMYQAFWLRFVHSFTGDQFGDTDNTVHNVLPFYQVSNMYLGRDFSLHCRWKASLSFEINNIFNTEYEARRGYPMPLSNYQFSLKIDYHKPIKHD